RPVVPHPAAAGVRRLVRQPLGGHRPFQRRPPAPPALPPHLQRTGTRERSVREPRSRCSSINSQWIDRVAQRLLKRAAHRAPPFLAERLEEEWLPDMSARRTSVARLRLAIGCCWAASVIAHEHGTPNVAAATARGGKTLAAPRHPSPCSACSAARAPDSRTRLTTTPLPRFVCASRAAWRCRFASP